MVIQGDVTPLIGGLIILMYLGYFVAIQIVKFRDPTENSLPIEEINFLRLYRLCQKLGTQSVRLFFNRYVPESALQSHLLSHNRWLIKSQYAPLLYKVGVKSSTFDLPLLYTLIRNTIPNLSPPTRGWGNQPNPSDTTESDDIERIRHYRNDLAHSTCLQLSNNDFKSQWFDLSELFRLLKDSVKGHWRLVSPYRQLKHLTKT